MDVALEIVDTFVFDHLYASLYPLQPAPYDFPNLNSNATAKTLSTWQYSPSTYLFSLEPSQAAYMSAWPRDNIFRQGISCFLITWFFGLLNYFIFSSLSYYFLFDKKTKEHPRYLRNQVWLEIKQANESMPGMSLLTAVLFLVEVRGYSNLYDLPSDGPGSWYTWAQIPFFLLFTDCCIYFIHRGLHHPILYRRLHKPHHKWIMPTPFASHAFHPVDGFMQSLPYHMYPFLFPMQKIAYMGLFIFVNIWTILIHDGEYMSNNPIINGAACHSIHHLAFNYNYGQYTTLWDRLGGSYRRPADELFDKEAKMSTKLWNKQVKEMEVIVKEVEGEDDRVYLPNEPKKTR